MNDEPDEKENYPVSPAKLSRTPSWIMLGFILGALFVWMLPREPEPAAAPVFASHPPPADPPRTALTTLTTIEAVFELWGQYAVWDGNTTEVALDAGSGTFSDFYEVKRVGDAYYFRSLTKLTRPIIRHGKPPPDGCPLQFTESEAQYREWREHGRAERPVEKIAPPPVGREQATVPLPTAPAVKPSAPPLAKPAVEAPPKD